MIGILIIMTVGIVLGVFLGILLLTLEKGNKKANRFFGALMILSSLCISDFAFTRLGFSNQAPYLIGIVPTVLFLIGPLYFFHVKELTGGDVHLKGKTLLHFVPFVLLQLYRLPFLLQSAESKLNILNNDAVYELEHKSIIVIQTIHVFVYLYMVYKTAGKYSEQTKNSTSDVAKVSLSWIKQTLNCFLVLYGFIAFYFVLLFTGIDLHPVYSAFIPLMISFTVVWMGFTGLRQPIIFPQETGASKAKKYEKSTLTVEQADLILNKLIALMEDEKVYLDGDLTLQKLADRILILPNHLSQVINDRTGQNFFDFVNAYRIKAAQQLLLDPNSQMLTISAIGEEVGFNSKSSFNTAFKKHSGKTPSQYKSEAASLK